MGNGAAPNSNAGVEQWGRVLTNIKEEIGEETFATWFLRVKLEKMSESKVILSVPTRFIRKYMESNYEGHIFDLWKRECEWIKSIEFIVRGMTKPTVKSEVGSGVKASVPALGNRYNVSANKFDEVLGGCKFDSKFTFDTFAVGASNQMAYAAAKEVTEQAVVGKPASYNPLYIASDLGMGKTHLLQAIATQIKLENRKVSYFTSEYFMRQFVEALRNQNADEFKSAIRSTSILLIDDMQFLKGKKTQEEFCHTLNEFIDGKKQIVCAGDRIPSKLDVFDERMRSRLKGGIVTEILTPDLELRKKVIRMQCEAEKIAYPDFHISEPIVNYIAERLATNGRDLVGAVLRLCFTYRFSKQPITLEIAEKAVKDLISSKEPYTLRVEDIFDKVANEFDVEVKVMLSNERSRSVAIPRQIAMYLAKDLTTRSLPEIGKKFGGRDHTTVLYAYRRVVKLMKEDKEMAKTIERMKYELKN